MLQLSVLREQRDFVIERLKIRNFKELDLVDQIINLDEQRRSLKLNLDNILAEINKASKEIGELFAKGEKETANEKRAAVSSLKSESKQLEEQLKEIELEIQNQLVKIPNLPHIDVPAGKTPEDNIVVRKGQEEHIKKGQALKPHWDLAVEYNLVDLELGTKLTGAGFPVYIGKGAKLQRALINYFLDKAIDAGYKEYIPPLMVNKDSAYGTGQLPDKDGQMYYVNEDNLYLIPTAEVPVTNVYRNVILKESDFPVKMVAYTPCFRREAGSYGKDVRGLNRVHQFDKVEIVQVAHPDSSYNVLDNMLNHVEGLLNDLHLPYRILKLCGGDMGFTSALTYDFEVYSVAQERWLEVSSVSNFETYQANRMQIRFKEDNKTRLVHTLNGSALALPRILASLLENYQEEDRIKIPEVLHLYTGFTDIIKE